MSSSLPPNSAGATSVSPAVPILPAAPTRVRPPPSVWKRFLIRHLAPQAAFYLLSLLRLTWRVRETGRHHFDEALATGRPPVVAFLHGRAFMLLNTIPGRQQRRWLSMCSKSLDGDGMTKLEQKMGLEVIRGSSGRDGLQALVDMIRRLRDTPGLGACLAVDGSRGPRGIVQGGIISLVQRTEGILIPVTLSANSAWIFRKAWDRTLFAKPFARIEVVFGPAVTVPAKIKGEAFAQLCLRLQETLADLQREADRRSGLSDTESVAAS